MVLNGRDTTLENWFSPKNLKSSPWTDLPKAKPNYFSMAGFKKKRRFYVSYTHFVCGGDKGWLIIIEAFYMCHWEIPYIYPRFIYSNAPSKAAWLLGYGSADTLAIFIRLIQK
ncbi:uncharacterized protein LOC118768555 [Octopus sinensis]|uniref:Uncharacterized protein LOC118768555 n=1 Tax=Octopus sinensis TaxID=2607531 RepID=A0A7E6FVC0_9MOLL|nr:uncharacterized protein LOC118768555 [Octopus sinensis]